MDYIALAIPLFFVLMGAELAWSAYTHRKVYRFNDFVANLGCGIGSQVVGAFTKTLIFAAYLWTYDHARLFTLERSVLTWIVAFLLVDLLYYWFHRLSHEVNFLWAAHIVHHQSEEYNLSVALRQSWWQGLFSWWFYLPMAVLGIHPVVIVTVGAFNTLYQFWIHTKAIGKMGPFEWLFNTPSHHRVHHGSDPKYIDRNHAGTLIVWDKLFGTFQREEEEPVYGITTPLSRWDPLTANFHYWGDLFRLAAQARTWGDKLRVFTKPPGWRPAYLGGYAGPVGKDRHTYRKFDTRVPAAVGGYVAMQFTLLLVVTTFFLFRHGDLGATRQWANGALIVVWVMNMGLLMEGRRWAAGAEVLRMAGLSMLLWFSSDLLSGVATLVVNTSVTLVSMVLLWNADRAMASTPMNSTVTRAD
ncbi:MAG: sterol desaturase family protein [Flavobacteriales bacterium]|jgi:sterol desaturase/sphingolipid hydroxylase (fatty acid hydroxylase superfamily)